MRFELLVGATEFWTRLADDLRSAEERAYLQTFTFEGDRVGIALGKALVASRARDRRFLVDCYSLLYHSDRVIPGPSWFDRRLRREVMLTHRWVRRLRDAGVGMRFSNPLGPWPVNVVRRNHKKIAVFDDRVAYIGGINFSEHNFAWHDMMFRVECDDLARLLSDDFLATWDGRSIAADRHCGDLRVISLNGRGNRAGMGPLVEAITGARRSIDVASAYLSSPFTDHLVDARARGVRVRVITPAENNKANLAGHILEVAHRSGIEVYRGPGMSHMKAMVVDGELLVVGSSNFDFMSYNILEELLVMTHDQHMIDTFVERVWKPDLAQAVATQPRSNGATKLGHAAVRIGALLAGALNST